MKTSKKLKLCYIIGIVLIILVSTIIVLHSQKNSVANNRVVENSDIYQVNANGQTYGYAETTSFEQLPDLIPAVGKNGIEAYMRKEDYLGMNTDKYDVYTVEITDDDVLEVLREQYKDQYPDVSKANFYKKCFDIPLFDVTGEKEVDQFAMSMGYYPYPEND